MSMGSLLLAGGAPGKRMALPNSRILIHQPSGGFQGQASDIEIHARETLDAAPAGRRDLRPTTPARASSRSTTTWTATATSPPRTRPSTGSWTGVIESHELSRLPTGFGARSRDGAVLT